MIKRAPRSVTPRYQNSHVKRCQAHLEAVQIRSEKGKNNAINVVISAVDLMSVEASHEVSFEAFP